MILIAVILEKFLNFLWKYKNKLLVRKNSDCNHWTFNSLARFTGACTKKLINTAFLI